MTALAPPASVLTALLAALVSKGSAAKPDPPAAGGIPAQPKDTALASERAPQFPQLFKDLSSEMGEPAAPATARKSQPTRPRQAVEQPKNNLPDDRVDRNAIVPPLVPLAKKPWSAAPPLPGMPGVEAIRAQPSEAYAPVASSRAPEPAAAAISGSAPPSGKALGAEPAAMPSVSGLEPEPKPAIAPRGYPRVIVPGPALESNVPLSAEANREDNRRLGKPANKATVPVSLPIPAIPRGSTQPATPRLSAAKSRSGKRPDQSEVRTSLPSPAAARDAAPAPATGAWQSPPPAIDTDDGISQPAEAAPGPHSSGAKPRATPLSDPLIREDGNTSRAPVPARPLAAEPQPASSPRSTTSAADSAAPAAPSEAPRAELAFAVDLRPALPPELAVATVEPVAAIPRPVASGRAAEPSLPAKVSPPSAAVASQPADDAPVPSAVDPPHQASRPAERHGENPENDAPPAAREKPRAAAPEVLQDPPPSSSADPPAALAATMVRPAPEVAHAPATAASRPAVAASPKEPVPATDSAASLGAAGRPATVRDIRLEVAGADSRVEVRVVERSGDVHVDVRTPDSRLAAELRGGLPALTARLEQAGFRAEAWHPPAAVQGRSPVAAWRAAAVSENSGQEGRSGGRGGRDDPQPKAKNAGGSRSKEDRQRFASLMGDLN